MTSFLAVEVEMVNSKPTFSVNTYSKQVNFGKGRASKMHEMLSFVENAARENYITIDRKYLD